MRAIARHYPDGQRRKCHVRVATRARYAIPRQPSFYKYHPMISALLNHGRPLHVGPVILLSAVIPSLPPQVSL